MPTFRESGRDVRATLLVAAMVAQCSGGAFAEDLDQRAQKAQGADAATTVLGLAAGLAEMNPLGPAVLLAKPAMIENCRSKPEEDRADCFAALASVGSGAAVNNVCMLAAVVLTAGAAAPACPLIGVAWGSHDWSGSEQEREFWAICRQWKKEHGPDFKCVYAPLGQPQLGGDESGRPSSGLVGQPDLSATAQLQLQRKASEAAMD